MIANLRISGVLFILLGLAHTRFGERLNWKSDLAKLTPINRQLFQVHCFYIGLLLIMLGALSLFCTEALLQPGTLARAILGGMTLLWVTRLYIQLFVFDPSLRRENSFNRTAHYLFVAFWVYAAAVDGLAFLSSTGSWPGQ